MTPNRLADDSDSHIRIASETPTATPSAAAPDHAAAYAAARRHARGPVSPGEFRRAALLAALDAQAEGDAAAARHLFDLAGAGG